MKPEHAAISRQDTIGRTQRLSSKKHLGRFDAPAFLVVSVNLVVPANRIFQPLFLRETESGLDLGADVSLADTAIEICHENNSGDLLYQRAVSGFKVGKLRILCFTRTRMFRWVYDVSRGCRIVATKNVSQIL